MSRGMLRAGVAVVTAAGRRGDSIGSAALCGEGLWVIEFSMRSVIDGDGCKETDRKTSHRNGARLPLDTDNVCTVGKDDGAD